MKYERLTKKTNIMGEEHYEAYHNGKCLYGGVIDRLGELEDKLESGLAFDLTSGDFEGTSAFVSREGTFGYPMLTIPITEEEVKTLINNGIEDCLDCCIILE